MNSQLEQSEKQIESLTNQIDTSNDNARKQENLIANLNRELLNKNDEVNCILCALILFEYFNYKYLN